MGWIVKRRTKTGGTRWVAQYRDPAGVIRSRTFDPDKHDERGRATETKEAAKAWLATVEMSKATGTYVDPSAARITLREWWPRFVEAVPDHGNSTMALYDTEWRCHIAPVLGAYRLGAITRGDVETWVAGLVAGGVGLPTVRAAYRVLRRALNAAVANEIIVRNPAAGVRLPKHTEREMRFLSGEELARVANAVPARYRALVLLLGLCGLRVGEATALVVTDVDLLRRHVRVTKAAKEVRGRLTTGPTKTGKARAVALPRIVAEALEAHIAQYPPGPGGLVFTSAEGHPVRRSHFGRRDWRRAVRDAGIADPLPRVHDLRHTAAALAIEARGHPKLVQTMLGHSSITITLDRYGHLFDSLGVDLADAMDAGFREASTLRAASRDRG